MRARNLLIGLIFVATAPALPVAAQVPQGITYVSRPACEQAGLLSIIDCNTAFRNARAEFDEKVPRYRNRRDCERVHGECTAQLAGDGFAALTASGAQFVPAFQGLRLVTRPDGQRVVTPLSAGKAIMFGTRPAVTVADKVASRRPVMGDQRQSFGRGGGTRATAYTNDPQTSGPYVRRGDRDDTVKVPMRRVNPDKTNEAGLFVDENGVEWYRPARRR
jgi:uncharacterized protein YgiB involved in biofilm formation